MTQWHKVVMSNDDIAAGKHKKLQEQFERIFITSAAPAGAGMFGSKDNSQTYNYFFSPGAMRMPLVQALVIAYSGTPCEIPEKDSTLLVGHHDSKNKLL